MAVKPPRNTSIGCPPSAVCSLRGYWEVGTALDPKQTLWLTLRRHSNGCLAAAGTFVRCLSYAGWSDGMPDNISHQKARDRDILLEQARRWRRRAADAPTLREATVCARLAQDYEELSRLH